MIKINGCNITKEFTLNDLYERINNTIALNAHIIKIRKKSGILFLYLRSGRYMIQAVCAKKTCGDNIYSLQAGDYVRIKGTVKREERALNGCEIVLSGFEILSQSASESPINISDKKLICSIEDNLANRTLTLRHPDNIAIFKILEGILNGWREYMLKNDFTEVLTPCITPFDDTKSVFKLKYFDKTAFLTSDPHLYAGACTAFFDRVFETAHIFRAEKHTSARHLCEFTALDFEMSFINGITELMQIEMTLLKYIIKHLKNNYGYELSVLQIELPCIDEIPSFTFHEVLDILGKPYEQSDLDPTDEAKLSAYSREKYLSDFSFITHFPKEGRPFYTMDSDKDNSVTESFDLLFKGIKIADGGQWIHNFDAQIKKAKALDVIPAEFNSYINLYKYGFPPRGGVSTGLERLIMKLLNLENIREASLFPRDFHRIVTF